MALLDTNINLMTIYVTYIQNPIISKRFLSNIPAARENCLSNLYFTEILFKESTTHYKDNLRQSGENKKLIYKPTGTIHLKHSKHCSEFKKKNKKQKQKWL